MTQNPSLNMLQSLLQSTARVQPRITEDARRLLGPLAQVLDRLGLPVRQGDWFHAQEEISVWAEAEGVEYKVNGESATIAGAVRIGRSDFGGIVVDCSTSHVVYVDQSGETQLINTSLERFLYFVGRFQQSADVRFSDVSKLRSEYEGVDPAPLRNPDGIWSLSLEEAEAGLY